MLYAFVLVHPVNFVNKIAHTIALLIFGTQAFGDTLLPRVHTASQQAHGKLEIDSVRFYTHKSLQVTTLGLRKAQKKKRKLVGGTAQDVQTSIRRRSPGKTALRIRVQVTNIWKQDNKNLERVKAVSYTHLTLPTTPYV